MVKSSANNECNELSCVEEPAREKIVAVVYKEKLRFCATSRNIEKIQCPEDELIQWEPEESVGVYRFVCFTSAAWESFCSEDDVSVQAQIMNALDFWVEGKKCWARMERKGLVGVFLKRLKPPKKEIWEIRVTKPKGNQTRLLGRFVEPNVFIICQIFHRTAIEKKWNTAIQEATEFWDKLNLSSYFVGSMIGDYLGETDHDKYPI